MPIDRIFAEAEEKHRALWPDLESLGIKTKSTWGYQDQCVQSLLRWFKNSFFSFVSNPDCENCSSPTVEIGLGVPSPAEFAQSV